MEGERGDVGAGNQARPWTGSVPRVARRWLPVELRGPAGDDPSRTLTGIDQARQRRPIAPAGFRPRRTDARQSARLLWLAAMNCSRSSAGWQRRCAGWSAGGSDSQFLRIYRQGSTTDPVDDHRQHPLVCAHRSPDTNEPDSSGRVSASVVAAGAPVRPVNAYRNRSGAPRDPSMTMIPVPDREVAWPRRVTWGDRLLGVSHTDRMR